MYTRPGFDDIAQTLQASWEEHLKVLPPKSSGRNGILTGSILYTTTLESGRKYDDQIAFMGPPCTMIPPIREGIVMYPKVTLNLNRRDGKIDESDPKDKAFTAERSAFMQFVKELEHQTLAKVKEDPKAFFGGKDIKPANVFVKDSFVEPEEDNYRTKFTCKVDVKDEAHGVRENIDWTMIKLDVHDVKIDVDNDEVQYTAITLEDVASRDKIVPMFRSAYPYFETVKNHRTGEFEGYLKIQWCLSGIQRIEKVADPKRRRDDDDSSMNPAWMKKIKQYMADNENEVETASTTSSVNNNNHTHHQHKEVSVEA